MVHSNVVYSINDIKQLKKTINQFAMALEDTQRSLRGDVGAIGQYWRDTQFDKFQEFMEELDRELGKCQRIMGESENELALVLRELLKGY